MYPLGPKNVILILLVVFGSQSPFSGPRAHAMFPRRVQQLVHLEYRNEYELYVLEH